MKGNSKKNFAYNLLYQLFILITPLVTAPYISRVFGPEGVGLYSFNYSIATYFVYFCLLGINNYGVREIAKCQTREERHQTFSNVYYTQLMVSLFVVLIYTLYLFSLTGLKFVVALCFVPYVVSGLLDINWFFFGTERFAVTTIRNCIVKILLIIFVFLLISKKEDVWIYCLIISLAALLTQIIMWFSFLKTEKLVKPDTSQFWKHLKGLIILFVPVLAVSLYRIMDKIMLGFLSSNNQVGYYENAEQIISVPGTITTALGISMLPRMTSVLSSNEERKFDVLFRNSVFFVEFICFPMAFGVLAVSDVFIPLYYGQDFFYSSNILKILCISFAFASLASVLRTQYLIPKNKDKIYIGSVICGACVNLIINAILIPALDGIGAAIGTVVANAVVAIYQFVFVFKEYKNVKSYLLGLPFILFGFLMYLTVVLVSSFLKFDGLGLFLIQILIGSISYIIFAFPFLFYAKKKNRGKQIKGIVY